MAEEELLPRLGPVRERFVYRILKITGPTESEVDRLLAPVHRNAGSLTWTILAGAGQIEIHLRERVPAGSSPHDLPRVEAETRARLLAAYEGEITELEQILKRHLSPWRVGGQHAGF